ncbi:MAG: hypothetical protein PHN41_06650 [Bacteroidales bacterium]|jgi:hypothetical protein|nr:hypothetical protein [Bacteroidales bacterium]MDD4703620.1 hypothetical protein [Bacteroidales bacterium]MDX9799680.1 hypothetical protein [Bacteroidales bacterium]
MSEKKEKKDQFIIAYLPELENTQAIIDSAISFAKMLKKGLILLYISDNAYKSISTTEAEIVLKDLNSKITDVDFHSYCAIEGKTKDIINKIPLFLSGVLLVSAASESKNNNEKLASNSNTMLKNLYTSRIAYFLVPQNHNSPISFNRVIMTINHMRESKEKVLWGSYFGRFANSEVIVYYHNYKDEFYRHQLHFNIKFLMRMFDNFKINYRLNLSSNSKTFVDYQAIDYAKETNAGLIICQTTKNKSWFEEIFNLKERKIINNTQQIPVLFVNPREDLFILCE